MKKKSASQSAFFNWHVLTGLFLVLTGVFLALLGFGQFSAQAQQNSTITKSINPQLLPPGFDCAQIRALGFDRQENLRAGAILIACGEAEGGTPSPAAAFSQFVQNLLPSPLTYGATDFDLINPQTDAGTHITQSETMTAANPDNPNEIVVAYNDSRSFGTSNNISGASVSTDGGTTFTRLTAATGRSPFDNTFGDPVVMYNRNLGTWFTVWLDITCGSFGLGGYKTTTPSDPNSWSHFCVHTGSSDDRESGAVDNNPASPHYGRMYVSWNDFAVGGNLKVRFSDDGVTWTERQLFGSTPFMRDVQSTVDLTTGDVYVAGMDEGGGGFPHNDVNHMFRSTDGGSTWVHTYTGPSFPGPGLTTCASNSYFACMFTGPSYWRHEGWGQPAANNGVVSLVYAQKGAGSDPGDVFYIRSTDQGATFGAPVKLNTDATTRPQWQPNISVAEDNSLLAVWYDARESTTCTKGNSGVPCYRMWARKSTDGGATWLADMEFSDVVTPLPGQPDGNIVAEYVGDYDYGNHLLDAHISAWADGRIPINGASQQDPFFDQDGGGGGANIVLEARVTGVTGNHQVQMRWSPADGGNVNILRNGAVIGTTADDGAAKNNVGAHTGSFTYQVCETDTGDCSNIVTVIVPQ
jgi:hypothetical protein